MPEGNNTEISDEDVVISGIAGSFPEAINTDELKEKLFDNAEFVKICEYSNWGKDNLAVPKFIGRISEHNSFDSTFFGIHKKQCDAMNSMLRNVLERSYEAIVDAGLSPDDVNNTRMGVMIGSNISESENTKILLVKYSNGYTILGHNRSLIANRISYYFNAYGPSYALQSAETSGVEVLTIAYEAIKKGYCDTALVGAVSFALHPEISYQYKGLGVLSEDGCTRSFDDNASGFVRSESSVVMFLQKAKYAKRIYASIVHSQFDCCGDRKAGYIVPLEYPLTGFLKSFYQRCGIDPSLISYLEADGSGIKDLDTKELNALAKVLLCNRQTPLPIGSIKSNLGHTDAASALVSVVKVLIAMETGRIPPNYNYNKPSQQVPALVEDKYKVVTEPMPWSGGLAAVNAVGLGGVVGHILLRSHSKEKVNGGLPTDDLPRLILISGRTEEGLKEVLTKLESQPVDVECLKLLHDIYSKNFTNYNYRGYTILGKDNKHREIQRCENLKRPVWFIFSGMGSQWLGMGSTLLQFPIISESIQRSHNILLKKGLDLLNIINSTDKNIFDNILHSFVGIAAIQIALVDFMKLLDITPDGYIGHSVGELGCAYMDGCFTAEETLLAAYYRGLASNETELIPGYMAAIGLGYKDVKDVCPPEIDVACHNSSSSSTISGPEEIVKTFVKQLQKEHIFARAVNVANIAYHSRYIRPAAPKLLEYLKKLVTDPKPRSPKWISSSVPENEWETPLAKYSSAEYHTNNLLSPVLFEESTKCIPNNAIVIEIAPHGLLQAIVRRSFAPKGHHIPLALRGHPNSTEFLLAAVGKLYMAGLLPKVSNLYPPVQYPVSRGTASLSSLVTWNHEDFWDSPLDIDTSQMEGFDTSVDHNFTICLNQKRDRMLEGHKLAGKVILPLSYLLQITWTFFCDKLHKNFTDTSVIFQDLHVHQHLEISEKGALLLSIFLQKASGNFEIMLDGISLVLTGRIVLSENTKTEFNKSVAVSFENTYDLTSNDVYDEMENRGYQYQDQFRGILNAQVGDQGCISTIKWRNNWCSFIDSLIQVVLFNEGESSQDIYLPVDIQQVVIHPSLHAEPQDYRVVYEKVTGIIRGGGVEMLGLKTSNVDIFKNNEACVKLESFKFVSHSNPRLQMLERFLEVTLQIVSENIHSASKNKSSIVEIEDQFPFELISQHIKTKTKDFPVFKDSVTKVSFNNVQCPMSNVHSLNSDIGLIITSIDSLEKFFGLCDNSFSFILARSIGKQTPKISDGLVVVIEQQFDNEKLLLLRKAVSVEEKAPVIYLAGDEHNWPQQLKSELKISNGYNTRVYVVIMTKAPVDGKTLIQQLSNEPKADKLRYIFILDENAPNFSLTEDIYLRQLQQNLVCNIYSAGSWGSFRLLPIDEMIEKPVSLSSLPALRLKNIQINHVGLNLRDPTVIGSIQEKKLNDIGNLDLSGTLEDGKRVMSIVQNPRNVSENSLDPYLTWDIPDSWSLEDAATVPWAYSTAYHCMIQAAALRSKETVLIHAGHTPIGQAAIAFALHIGSTVFTTVTEIVHKEFLMKRFPLLQGKNILSLASNIDITLMQETKGEGVKVIINCLRGSKLHSSLQCVSVCGRFVQLGMTDMEENTSIGMSIFLKHVAVLGIAVDNIFNASLAWKKELHSAIKEGIKSGIVQPLGNVLFTEQQTLEALRELSNCNNVTKVLIQLMEETRTPKNKKVVNKIKAINKSIFDLKNSHIIIGNKFEDCLCLAEWLVTHKANKIIIASKSQKLSVLSERRMFLLHRYHNAHIIQTSAEKIHTLPGARSLIRNASNLGTVTTIFSIALNDATSLHNLDVASRSLDSLSHFVSLMDKSGKDVSKERFKAGLPILDVQWNDSHKSENIRPILKVMNKLLSSRSPPFINMSLEDKLIKYTNEVSRFNEIGSFLPSSLDELEGVGFDFLSKAKSPLVVIPSLSPGIGLVPEVPPIFIVPGIQDKIKKVLETLTNKILYPTICINLQDHNNSVSNSAGIIVKHMRNIQPVGPYNLVGVSWGGILALELARELQSQDQKIQLFLLDGAPDTTQSIAKLLGTGDELQCNLITRLLGIESNKVQEEIIHFQDWKTRVAYALNEMADLSPKRKLYLENGLESTYLRIIQLLNYKPTDKLLSGDVHLIRPKGDIQEDNCSLHKYFQGTVNVHLVEGDQRTLLSNRATADIINNETLVNIRV